MKKKVEFVLLPTESKSIIYKHTNGLGLGKHSLHIGDNVKGKESDYIRTNQHLYITVSQDIESVEEGDWVYFPNQTQDNLKVVIIEKFSKDKTKVIYCNNGYYDYTNNCRKIISTTDPKLNREIEGARGEIVTDIFPQLQQSAIKKYVDNPDGEFEVEYENIELMSQNVPRHLMSYENRDIVCKLKLNQDNAVNITYVDNVLVNAEIVYRKIYKGCDKDEDVSNVLPSYISFWKQMNETTSVEEKVYSREELGIKISDFAREFAYKQDMEMNSSLNYTIDWIIKNL